MKFSKAIAKMYEDGEFEKIIKHTKGKEKLNVKIIHEALAHHNGDIGDIPMIPLLMGINSVEVLKDAIIYMAQKEEN